MLNLKNYLKGIKKVSFLLSSFCLVFISLSCENNVDNDGDKINPNIILLKSCCDNIVGGNYIMGEWLGSKIYYTAPLGYSEINEKLEPVNDSIIGLNLGIGFIYLSKNTDETKLLVIQPIYSNVSSGALYEIDVQNNNLRKLKDNAFNISSVRYLNNNNEKCIYYSFGNPNENILPGYYLLDIATGIDSLILYHASDLGQQAYAEFVNGFDIMPNNDGLIIPIHSANKPAKMAKYSFATKQIDTLNIEFSDQFVWLRFNNSGSQILYCTYPWGIGASNANNPSEIGIIDINTFSKRVLDVRTRTSNSMSLFPNWSSDYKSIVFGSAKGPVSEPPGTVGFYSVYLLTNIN